MTSGDGACLFCRIAQGLVPSQIVHESDRIVAFLDINPIRAGHVQIVPRSHYPYYDDVPAEVMREITALGQRLAPILRAQFRVPRVAFLFTGGDIAHAHAHVVPMVEPTDITSTQYIAQRPLSFRNPPRVAPEELLSVAAALRGRLESGHEGDA